MSELTWTTESPKVAGYYLAEYVSKVEEYKETLVIEVLWREHWRHKDWEEKKGKLSCLLAIEGVRVGPTSKYSRFAGPIPIPTPKEP